MSVLKKVFSTLSETPKNISSSGAISSFYFTFRVSYNLFIRSLQNDPLENEFQRDMEESRREYVKKLKTLLNNQPHRKDDAFLDLQAKRLGDLEKSRKSELNKFDKREAEFEFSKIRIEKFSRKLININFLKDLFPSANSSQILDQMREDTFWQELNQRFLRLSQESYRKFLYRKKKEGSVFVRLDEERFGLDRLSAEEKKTIDLELQAFEFSLIHYYSSYINSEVMNLFLKSNTEVTRKNLKDKMGISKKQVVPLESMKKSLRSEGIKDNQNYHFRSKIELEPKDLDVYIKIVMNRLLEFGDLNSDQKRDLRKVIIHSYKRDEPVPIRKILNQVGLIENTDFLIHELEILSLDHGFSLSKSIVKAVKVRNTITSFGSENKNLVDESDYLSEKVDSQSIVDFLAKRYEIKNPSELISQLKEVLEKGNRREPIKERLIRNLKNDIWARRLEKVYILKVDIGGNSFRLIRRGKVIEAFLSHDDYDRQYVSRLYKI